MWNNSENSDFDFDFLQRDLDLDFKHFENDFTQHC